MIDLLLSLTLAGDTLISLGLTTRADRWGRRATLAGGALVLGLGLACGEWLGWPWLVQPAADVVGRLIERRVDVGAQARARLHLWGGLRLSAPLSSSDTGSTSHDTRGRSPSTHQIIRLTGSWCSSTP